MSDEEETIENDEEDFKAWRLLSSFTYMGAYQTQHKVSNSTKHEYMIMVKKIAKHKKCI